MARSSYVYVVFDTETNRILGTFTVKYAAQYCRGQHSEPTYCWRYRDGVFSDPVEM
jgi:hypothetical protein